MMRFAYNWALNVASHPYALWILAAVSFLESSVFPIPPDLIMIPMILAVPRKAFIIAGICLVSSVAGGLLGYYIGFGLYEQVGRPVLQLLGKEQYFATFSERYNEYGAWTVLFAGLTPFPYKVITILSGATGLSLTVFLVSSIVARGARFFLVAALLWKFGDPIRTLIEKRLGMMFALFLVLLAAGFYGVRLL
ncbi:MAG: DedA family protein [Albidovulum sp.]|nr:DedA family protein [Albidovulum sp.]MDE0531068.1 DedA family protein [Albidovulum sp.]